MEAWSKFIEGKERESEEEEEERPTLLSSRCLKIFIRLVSHTRNVSSSVSLDWLKDGWREKQESTSVRVTLCVHTKIEREKVVHNLSIVSLKWKLFLKFLSLTKTWDQFTCYFCFLPTTFHDYVAAGIPILCIDMHILYTVHNSYVRQGYFQQGIQIYSCRYNGFQWSSDLWSQVSHLHSNSSSSSFTVSPVPSLFVYFSNSVPLVWWYLRKTFNPTMKFNNIRRITSNHLVRIILWNQWLFPGFINIHLTPLLGSKIFQSQWKHPSQSINFNRNSRLRNFNHQWTWRWGEQ